MENGGWEYCHRSRKNGSACVRGGVHDFRSEGRANERGEHVAWHGAIFFTLTEHAPPGEGKPGESRNYRHHRHRHRVIPALRPDTFNAPQCYVIPQILITDKKLYGPQKCLLGIFPSVAYNL